PADHGNGEHARHLRDPVTWVRQHLHAAVVGPSPDHHPLVRGQVEIGQQTPRGHHVHGRAVLPQVPPERVDHMPDTEQGRRLASVQVEVDEAYHLGEVEDRTREKWVRGQTGLDRVQDPADTESHPAAPSSSMTSRPPAAATISSMRAARSRSRGVTPPAEWVVQESVRVRHRRSMSGWWFISSATTATWSITATAAVKLGNSTRRRIAAVSPDHPGRVPSTDRTSSGWSN